MTKQRRGGGGGRGGRGGGRGRGRGGGGGGRERKKDDRSKKYRRNGKNLYIWKRKSEIKLNK